MYTIDSKTTLSEDTECTKFLFQLLGMNAFLYILKLQCVKLIDVLFNWWQECCMTVFFPSVENLVQLIFISVYFVFVSRVNVHEW